MKRPLTSKIMQLIENCLGRRLLIQPRTTYYNFKFSKLTFSKYHFATNFRVYGNGTYFKNYASKREFHGNTFFNLPSSTQQNLNCFQTQIFEYYVSE